MTIILHLECTTILHIIIHNGKSWDCNHCIWQITCVPKSFFWGTQELGSRLNSLNSHQVWVLKKRTRSESRIEMTLEMGLRKINRIETNFERLYFVCIYMGLSFYWNGVLNWNDSEKVHLKFRATLNDKTNFFFWNIYVWKEDPFIYDFSFLIWLQN